MQFIYMILLQDKADGITSDKIVKKYVPTIPKNGVLTTLNHIKPMKNDYSELTGSNGKFIQVNLGM